MRGKAAGREVEMKMPMAGVALALSILSGPALAQQDLKTACRGDYMKFCSAHRPGTPEVEKCFRDNIRQVSETCKAAIRASRGQSSNGVARRVLAGS
jgi:hypothetical protein